MGKFWHRIADETGKIQLQEVAQGKTEVTGRTLVYLSGFLTNNNRPGYISGSIKAMEDMLKGHIAEGEMPKIYGWTHTDLWNLFNLAAYDTMPQSRSSQAGYDVGAGILMPLVVKDFKYDAKSKAVSGTPLPMDEVKKNLKNVTFFGYSAGSIVAQETYNATFKMMKKVGFNEKDAREALKQVALVAVGTISRPSKEINRFTTVTMIASNDRINRFKNMAWGMLGTIKRIIPKWLKQWGKVLIGKESIKSLWTNFAEMYNGGLKIRPLSETTVFITTPVRASLYEVKTDENGERVKKPFSPLYPEWLQRRSYHEMVHYITQDDRNNPFSRIARTATRNAILRDGTPDALTLIKAPAVGTLDTDAEKAAYNARIKDAMREMPRRFQQKV